MIHTGTDDDAVLLLIASPQAAGTILFTKFCSVPCKAPQHGTQLLFIGIEGKPMCPGVFLCPPSDCLNLPFIHTLPARRHSAVRMRLPMICLGVLIGGCWLLPLSTRIGIRGKGGLKNDKRSQNYNMVGRLRTICRSDITAALIDEIGGFGMGMVVREFPTTRTLKKVRSSQTLHGV